MHLDNTPRESCKRVAREVSIKELSNTSELYGKFVHSLLAVQYLDRIFVFQFYSRGHRVDIAMCVDCARRFNAPLPARNSGPSQAVLGLLRGRDDRVQHGGYSVADLLRAGRQWGHAHL